MTKQNKRPVYATWLPQFLPPLLSDSDRQDPCAMAVSITQAEYDSLISRLAAIEEENAATLLEVDT